MENDIIYEIKTWTELEKGQISEIWNDPWSRRNSRVNKYYRWSVNRIGEKNLIKRRWEESDERFKGSNRCWKQKINVMNNACPGRRKPKQGIETNTEKYNSTKVP